MARSHGGEDPGTKPATLRRNARQRQPANPSGVDLQLMTGLAIDNRDRRGGASEVQLQHREAMERRIRNHHALADEQFADLGEPESVS